MVNSTRDRIIDSGGVNTIQSSVSFDLGSTQVSGVNNLIYTSSIGGVLKGNAAANSITGAEGDDTLYGGGNDTLIGAGGIDIYVVNSTSDTIVDTGGFNLVFSSVSYDLSSAQVSGVNYLLYNGTAGGLLKGNAANNYLWGAQGNDSISAGAGNDTLQAFAKNGGVIQNGNFETDVMTGGDGADTFVLGDSKGSFYLDSGKYYPGVTSSKSDASWCAITDFEIGKDQLILSKKAYDTYGYTYYTYGELKNDSTTEVVAAFTASSGITPRDSDLLVYQGDPLSGSSDFIAGIRTTTGQPVTPEQIASSFRLV